MATCSGEQVMALSWGKDECLHVGEEIEWSVLLLSIVLLTSTSSLRTWIDFGFVKMGNKSYSKIVRSGDVCI